MLRSEEGFGLSNQYCRPGDHELTRINIIGRPLACNRHYFAAGVASNYCVFDLCPLNCWVPGESLF